MLPGKEIPKQRGIYSEILTTEDASNIAVSLIQATHITSERLHLWSQREKAHRDQPEAKDATCPR